uniref:Rab9 effector protein with kelch motifs n=1 Tax=Anthurium amnicola TaxID=1678845 RepID=A0A1D1YZC3_9ARAE
MSKKAMWLYPKVMGFNPSERWGHSACCCDAVVYVFGGCCGGLHFGEVLTLDLNKMVWSSMATTGERPGSRDSHSAAIVGHRMIVFGGTNGSKKVNDLHILDLRTKEWNRPLCKGNPPSPRESHSATVIGEEKLVIFGGSGEGEANYLNDVHILDLKTMTWTYPEVKGELPVPRDSHTAVAIGNRLLVYGGDCGDRYHGEVDVLDIDTLTWSRLVTHGSSPGVRAGHAAVNVGGKVYIIGGIGDKRYYSDVWVVDVNTFSWTQLEICGQQPQGRFSHTATVNDSDIVIYGGCGEDERPLNELLILQLGSVHPNGRYNISMCKIFGSHWTQEKRRFPRGVDNSTKSAILGNREVNTRSHEAKCEPKRSLFHAPDNVHPKRRRTGGSRTRGHESEQEEHSLSLSQHSSPSLSDQEQANACKLTPVHSPFEFHHVTNPCQPNNTRKNHLEFRNSPQKIPHGLHSTQCESPRQRKIEQFLHGVQHGREEVQFLTENLKPQLRPAASPLIGAEVHGMVDGAFDSGYLMTANVNGRIFRGVLFAPGPGFVAPRSTLHSQSLPVGNPFVIALPSSSPTQVIPDQVRPLQQLVTFTPPESGHHSRQAQPAATMETKPAELSELQGVVLTLGGPGGEDCGTR